MLPDIAVWKSSQLANPWNVYIFVSAARNERNKDSLEEITLLKIPLLGRKGVELFTLMWSAHSIGPPASDRISLGYPLDTRRHE